MYAKLFSRITESSLMEEPINVRYTFVMLLAIADPKGYAIGTDVAICRRLNMPVNEFKQCVEILMRPDPDSNSKEEEGRRVILSDGERGYKIVNYLTYREIKDQQERREYMKEYMRSYRGKKPGKRVRNRRKQQLTELTQAEAEGKEEGNGEVRSASFPDRFMAAWNKLPEPFPKVRSMSQDRLTALRSCWRDVFWKENWEAAMSLLPSCSFASGQNDRGWVADVDFFLKPGTVAKIMEGKYNGNGSKPPVKRPMVDEV